MSKSIVYVVHSSLGLGMELSNFYEKLIAIKNNLDE